MSGIGRRIRDGIYEVTFEFDAEDCEAMAAGFPYPDTFGTELYELAEEIRRRERERNNGPGLHISINAYTRLPEFVITRPSEPTGETG